MMKIKHSNLIFVLILILSTILTSCDSKLIKQQKADVVYVVENIIAMMQGKENQYTDNELLSRHYNYRKIYNGFLDANISIKWETEHDGSHGYIYATYKTAIKFKTSDGEILVNNGVTKAVWEIQKTNDIWNVIDIIDDINLGDNDKTVFNKCPTL